MAILLKPLRCPHCTHPVTRQLLKDRDSLGDFLKSRPFPCPHCEQGLLYPEKADTTLSAGIFVAVILAPLFHYWQIAFITPPQLFLLGAVIAIVGLFTQSLDKASLPNDGDSEDDTEDKGESS